MKQMALTDIAIKNLKPRERLYKASDRDGLYVSVMPSGLKSFRFDYRFDGRRKTLTVGRYGAEGISLSEAREKLTTIRRRLRDGIDPGWGYSDGIGDGIEAQSISEFAEKWIEKANLADSTYLMRKSILDREIIPTFGNKRLGALKASEIIDLCDQIVARGAPATAVHVREILNQIYRYAADRGSEIDNPAAKIRASAIATFKPRDRALSPDEIGKFFPALERSATHPALKMALKFVLLTMLRKGELINARWDWVDFEKATFNVPAEFMKARRPHIVFLSKQAIDLLVGMRACAGASRFVLPGRYDSDQPISAATLNQTISYAFKRLDADGIKMERFTVHDLRRTASTLLHEAGYNSDWIEKCLAHEQRGVRAVYNKAEYADHRRAMLQEWANLIDTWIKA